MTNYRVLPKFLIKLLHENEALSRIQGALMGCIPLLDQLNLLGPPKWEVNLVMDKVEQEIWLIPKLKWENPQSYMNNKTCGTRLITLTVEGKLTIICKDEQIWWSRVQMELIVFWVLQLITTRIQLTKHYKISQNKVLLKRTAHLRIWRQQDQVWILLTKAREYLTRLQQMQDLDWQIEMHESSNIILFILKMTINSKHN